MLMLIENQSVITRPVSTPSLISYYSPDIGPNSAVLGYYSTERFDSRYIGFLFAFSYNKVDQYIQSATKKIIYGKMRPWKCDWKQLIMWNIDKLRINFISIII